MSLPEDSSVIIYAPNAKHTHTVIFLHGRDSTAKEFAPEFFESQASDGRSLSEVFPGTKWIFPTAEMLISARFGVSMSQWFDMHTTENPHERQDEQDLTASVSRIQNIVTQEAAIVGPDGVVLGGISQGCATAVHALLQGELCLGGFIGLCAWFPRPDTFRSCDTNAAVRTPVLLSHAQDDEVIDIRFGEELREKLATLGMDVRWTSHVDGGHWINEPQGVDDIVLFLEQVGAGNASR